MARIVELDIKYLLYQESERIKYKDIELLCLYEGRFWVSTISEINVSYSSLSGNCDNGKFAYVQPPRNYDSVIALHKLHALYLLELGE